MKIQFKISVLLAFMMALVFSSFATVEEDVQFWNSGNEAFQNGDYSAAISSYESITSYEKRAEVLYNIGVAYHKTGQLGRAIWAFEKAHALAPNEKDIQENLALATRQIDNPFPDNSFILLQWWRKAASFLTPNVWSVLFFVGLGLVVLLLSTLIFQKKKRPLLLVTSVAFTALSGLLLWQSVENVESTNYAIIVKNATEYYADQDQTQVVERTIPEGTKVRILAQDETVTSIQLPNGVIAYLSKSYLQAL